MKAENTVVLMFTENSENVSIENEIKYESSKKTEE